MAAAIMGYCAAVRSSLSDEGRAPLDSPGLRLKQRLQKVAESLDRLPEQEKMPKELQTLRKIVGKGLEETKELWPEVEEGYTWLHKVAKEMSNKGKRKGRTVRKKVEKVVQGMPEEAEKKPEGKVAQRLKRFVKV
jgi:hypothetical protein